MKVEHAILPLAQLVTNTGQLEGVPANPREVEVISTGSEALDKWTEAVGKNIKITE